MSIICSCSMITLLLVYRCNITYKKQNNKISLHFSCFSLVHYSNIQPTIKYKTISWGIECFNRCIVLQCFPRSGIDFFWMLMILLFVCFSKETLFAIIPNRSLDRYSAERYGENERWQEVSFSITSRTITV